MIELKWETEYKGTLEARFGPFYFGVFSWHMPSDRAPHETVIKLHGVSVRSDGYKTIDEAKAAAEQWITNHVAAIEAAKGGNHGDAL